MSQPDFVLAWNMGFDIPYIIERIKILGYDPADVMCHPDFKYKVAKYYIDERNYNEFAERGDYAIISSYSVFLDQMIHFASRRKGQAQFTSFGLDFIGEAVAKVHKLDYSHITTNIAELPYKDYKTFVFYNIMDTIVQKSIEKKTGDINYIFGKCVNNNTRYQKGHRQTVYLANRGAKEFLKEGFIIGNNANKRNQKPDTKFPGAFVGDPGQVSDYAKIKIHDIPIDVFDNLDDFDYASLYPSILREFNMAPNTQVGMVTIKESVNDNENKFNSEKYSRSGAFMEDLQSGVYLEFCHRWLNMGNYLELYKDIIEFFTYHQMPGYSLRWSTPEGLIIPATFHNKDLLIKPAVFEEGLIKPIQTYIVPKIDNVEVYKEYEFSNNR
jgi:DNA polymerase elongation subunit (family B)